MATQIAAFPKTKAISNAWRILAISLFAGFLMSVFWSAELVDSEIGQNVADGVLGYDASETNLTSSFAGAVFAFVTGFAGTFTACNICAFGAIGPLAADKRSMGQVMRPLLYLALGMIVVSTLYGAIGALVGDSLPQLSDARLGDPETGIRVRLVQSMVVFCTIGVVYILWGLMSLNIIRNPFANWSAAHPWARPAFMGATIGAFLIGRPFGLFRSMFEYAASTHNPLYGALAFILQSLGNILLMVGIFLFLLYGTKGRFENWLHARPNRGQVVTAVALLVGGMFFFSYWGPRMLARNGLFYWPFFDWDTLKFMLFRA